MGLFKKTIDLHFYTNLGYVHEFGSIQTNSFTKPKWFTKILPQNYLGTSIPEKTLKRCPGVQDYYKKIIQMPLWSDLELEIGPKGSDFYKWTFSDKMSSCRVHNADSINNYRKSEEFQHLLLETPWVVKCNENISFLVCQPLWHTFDFPTISITQGILDFHTQSSCNAQAFITRTNKKQNILIPHGTPILELMPLTDKKIQVHNHILDELEYNKLKSYSPYTKFSGGYYYNKAFLKKNKN